MLGLGPELENHSVLHNCLNKIELVQIGHGFFLYAGLITERTHTKCCHFDTVLKKVFFWVIVQTFHQGRSQTFSFGGATGGASFATRGAVNGLCRTSMQWHDVTWKILGEPLGRPGKIFGGQCPPWHPPSSAPAFHYTVRYSGSQPFLGRDTLCNSAFFTQHTKANYWNMTSRNVIVGCVKLNFSRVVSTYSITQTRYIFAAKLNCTNTNRTYRKCRRIQKCSRCIRRNN